MTRHHPRSTATAPLPSTTPVRSPGQRVRCAMHRKAVIARRCRIPAPPFDKHDIGAGLLGGELAVADARRVLRLLAVGTDDAEVGVGDAEQILEIKALARHGLDRKSTRLNSSH